MSQPGSPETLQVLYDGECPLCRREIAHVRGLAQGRADSGLCFVDISGGAGSDSSFAADRATLMARFHVQRADGSRLDGARAFVAMWQRLPGWRWLARLSRLPGALALLEWAYRGFLRVRPALQALARRVDSPRHTGEDAPGVVPAPAMTVFLERELRSDHAGETGAVFIYRGMAAMAARRGDAELLAFAQRHGAAEAEHLRLIEAWLPLLRRRRRGRLAPGRLADGCAAGAAGPAGGVRHHRGRRDLCGPALPAAN